MASGKTVAIKKNSWMVVIRIRLMISDESKKGKIAEWIVAQFGVPIFSKGRSVF